jgi:Tfp pilus assembly protein PilN
LTPFTVVERDRAGTLVLAAAAPLAEVRAHLDELAAAGLDPALVDLGAVATTGLVQLASADALLVEPRDDGAVALLRGGRLAGLRVIDGVDRASLESQVRWSALALAGIELVPPLLLLDAGAEAASSAARLAAELGTTQVPRAQALPGWAAQVPAAHLRALALAARAAGLVPLGLNFRTGGLSYHAPSEEARRQLRSTGMLAGVAVVLGILAFAIAIGERRSELGALQDEVARNVTSVMPGAARGTERARLEAAIDGLEKRRETLSGAVNGRPPTLEILRAIADSVPEKTPFEVDDFSLDGDGVRIHARTNSYESVDVLKRALQSLPRVRDPQVKDVKTAVDGRVEFRAVLAFAREGSS